MTETVPHVTLMLMHSYRRPDGTLHNTGDVIDIPDDEARRLLDRNKGIETVPPVEANGRRVEWLTRFGEKVDANARRNPDTEAHYRAHFEKWRAWCAERSIPAVPVSPDALVRYLLERGADGAAEPTLSGITSAVAWFHECSSHPPTRAVLVAIVNAACRRAVTRASADVPPQTCVVTPHRQQLFQHAVALADADP
ncbi:hypothetical protein, partial [Microbaculum marinisediminis]